MTFKSPNIPGGSEVLHSQPLEKNQAIPQQGALPGMEAAKILTAEQAKEPPPSPDEILQDITNLDEGAILSSSIENAKNETTPLTDTQKANLRKTDAYNKAKEILIANRSQLPKMNEAEIDSFALISAQASPESARVMPTLGATPAGEVGPKNQTENSSKQQEGEPTAEQKLEAIKKQALETVVKILPNMPTLLKNPAIQAQVDTDMAGNPLHIRVKNGETLQGQEAIDYEIARVESVTKFGANKDNAGKLSAEERKMISTEQPVGEDKSVSDHDKSTFRANLDKVYGGDILSWLYDYIAVPGRGVDARKRHDKAGSVLKDLGGRRLAILAASFLISPAGLLFPIMFIVMKMLDAHQAIQEAEAAAAVKAEAEAGTTGVSVETDNTPADTVPPIIAAPSNPHEIKTPVDNLSVTSTKSQVVTPPAVGEQSGSPEGNSVLPTTAPAEGPDGSAAVGDAVSAETPHPNAGGISSNMGGASEGH